MQPCDGPQEGTEHAGECSSLLTCRAVGDLAVTSSDCALVWGECLFLACDVPFTTDVSPKLQCGVRVNENDFVYVVLDWARMSPASALWMEGTYL